MVRQAHHRWRLQNPGVSNERSEPQALSLSKGRRVEGRADQTLFTGGEPRTIRGQTQRKSQVDPVQCFAALLAAAALGDLGAGGGIDCAGDGLGNGGDEVAEANAALRQFAPDGAGQAVPLIQRYLVGAIDRGKFKADGGDQCRPIGGAVRFQISNGYALCGHGTLHTTSKDQNVAVSPRQLGVTTKRTVLEQAGRASVVPPVPVVHPVS